MSFHFAQRPVEEDTHTHTHTHTHTLRVEGHRHLC